MSRLILAPACLRARRRQSIDIHTVCSWPAAQLRTSARIFLRPFAKNSRGLSPSRLCCMRILYDHNLAHAQLLRVRIIGQTTQSKTLFCRKSLRWWLRPRPPRPGSRRERKHGLLQPRPPLNLNTLGLRTTHSAMPVETEGASCVATTAPPHSISTAGQHTPPTLAPQLLTPLIQ